MPARVEATTERTLTAAVTRIDASLPVDSIASPRRETQARLDRIAIGQLLQGNVIAQMEDGSFTVELSGMRLRMQLPADSRVGQKINLSLLSRNPQPSFQIESDGYSMTQTRQTTTSLSAGARLIDSVLLAQSEQDSPPVVTSRLPVLNVNTNFGTTRMTAPEIAQALRQTIEFSGLFYEAHVAAWANGNHPLAALSQEPQQRRKLEAGNAASALTITARPAEDAIENPQTGLTPELTQLVSAQIETLEHHRFVWQGEAWSGQPMVLEMARQGHSANDDPYTDPDDEPDSGSPRQTVWQTSMRLQLPEMGTVTAHIHLIGERLRIEIEGENATTVQTLNQQRPQLARSMNAAGLGQVALSVSASND